MSAVLSVITICAPLFARCQSCSGHWVTNHPLTYECISGQHIGYNNNVGPPDPPGCPANPVYTASQTNSFIFDNPVNDFFIDFNAFDAVAAGCPRMQIKINGLFYPLTVSNLTELPSGTICSESSSFLIITSDGYITSSSTFCQGRLVFIGVTASSITISTNDALGTVVANPCFAPLPIQIKRFKGFSTANCEINLEFESGIESNVRNIQIEGSFDGISFSKLLEVLPKGSDSRYTTQYKSAGSNFYRLKINDLDGNFSYSEIIRINDKCASLSIHLFPDPASQKIFVENVKLNDQLIIVDMMGRKVLHQVANNNLVEINIQHLSSGLYFLTLYRRNIKVETVKFSKS